MSEIFKIEVPYNWDLVDIEASYFGLDRADFTMFNTRERNRYARILSEDLEIDRNGVI